MGLKQKRTVFAVGVGFLAAGAMVAFCGPASGQSSFASAGETQAAPVNAGQASGEVRATTSSRADAYFNYTMGHIAEQQYEQTNRSEYATQAIEYYKKAYALDPKSPVIGERLAEMYWKAQRVREAEAEAKGILQRDPNDVQTRRLLGHIYLRSLGDANGSGQTEAVTRAVEQFKEVVRLDPADTESALWLARLYRLQNKHDKAEEVLRGILKTDPDNEAGVEQLTQLLLDQGKSAEAVALLENVTEKTSSPTLLDLLGDAYTQTNDLAKAEGAYRKASELDPSELSHQRGLGQTLLSEEKYQDALKVYQRLADLMPDDSDVYLRIAQIYRELHQLDKAEETLTKARQYLPGSLDVMYQEAMLYRAQGRNEDAIRVLSEAVAGLKNQSDQMPSRRRNLAVMYQQLGKLYNETENYQAAIYTYDELGHLGEEEDRRARLLLMETHRSAKDLPKALQTGKDALAKYPADNSIRSSYALLLGEAAKTEEALTLLKPQLKGTDADRDVYLNIAQVYERARKYPEAEKAARTAEAIPGAPRDNEMTWFLLGAIYERQKLYDRAEVEFKKVLAVEPQNAAALNYYGYMLGDLGIRLDEAEAMVKKALAEDAFNGAYLDSLGWIYYKQGKYAEAEDTLRKAAARETHDPTIHSHLGDVYARRGRVDLAAAQWEKSLEEWRRVLPADLETDKIAEVEKKVSQSKHRVAQKSSPNAAQPK
ncbi:MAG TPA: tetratricopeptide repeat protein [Candidatus Acidoferrum sp.]|nr:tetratricopeptide repeat protein [Candidatus Acidoferrum sp.]